MSNRALVDALRKAVEGPSKPQKTVVGIVASVDTGAATCVVEPLNGDADVIARYMSDVSGKTQFVPAVDSVVVVQMFSPVTGVVVGYSGLNNINLLGDNLGGMVKINDLLQVINALQTDLNNLKTIFNGWVVVPNDGGAALKVLAATWMGQTITPTTLTEIENPKIRHGDG
mgnify:CR=1 FL=1